MEYLQKSLRLLFLTVALFSFSGLDLLAGGWVHEKGKGYFKLGQTYLRSDKFYEKGELVDIFTTGAYFTSLYGEYGISDRWTGIAYVPFFSRMTVNEVEFTSGRMQPGDSYNGFGDTDIGIKYGLRVGKPFVMSATLQLGLPLGRTDGGETGVLQTGDGEFNQLVRLEAGYAPPKTPLYFNAGVGFNNRTNGFSEEFRYNFEAGFTKDKFLGALKMDGIKSFFNGDGGGGQNGVFSNNLEFISITPEVAYQLKGKIGITANVGVAVYGNRILAAPNYGGGIYLKL
ncbi:MAG: hypothetical protein ACFB10_08490 [Salibacteraceae bacterium]